MKKENNFSVLSKINYLLIVVGIIFIVLGFISMSGGGTDDPNVFTGDKLFDFRRLTLSTILILLGFTIEIFAILYRPKNKNNE